MLDRNTKKIFSETIKIQAELMLQRLRIASCPVWRFHYLGAISAYLQLAKTLDSTIDSKTLAVLQHCEEQALECLQQPNLILH